jgi:hypothetical protein
VPSGESRFNSIRESSETPHMMGKHSDIE